MSVPTLRFPEFSGEWEDTRLDSYGIFKSGVGFPEIEQGGKAGMPFFKVSDMNLAGNEDVLKRANHYVTDEQVYRLKYKPIKNKSVVFAKVGAAVFLERKRIAQDFLIDNNMMAFTPNSKITIEYSAVLFRNTRLSKFAQVGALPSYNGSDLASIKVVVPSLPEQKKIAAFLGVVDAKIAALRARRDGLERYKRGLMQALFSQTLRFTKEDGSPFPDWEEKRLGDLLMVRYGKDHKGVPDGEIPVFGTGGIMRHVDRSLHDGPSVLIGRKGTIDKPRFVTQPFWTVDTLFYSDIKQGYLPFFVFLVVQWINWLKYNEATGVPSLSATAIHSVKVTVPPHPDEQQKIADALSAMDAKITAVADQVTQMETFKKGLLQQMFV